MKRVNSILKVFTMILVIMISFGFVNFASDSFENKKLREKKKVNKVKGFRKDEEIRVLFEDKQGNYVISASKKVKDKKKFNLKLEEGWNLTIDDKTYNKTYDKTKSFYRYAKKNVFNSYIDVAFATTATRKRGISGDSCVVDTFQSDTAWVGTDPFYSDKIVLSNKMSFSGTDITSVSAGATGGGIGWSTSSSSSTVTYVCDDGDCWNLEMSFDGITAYAPNGSITCYMHDAIASHELEGYKAGVAASGYVFY